MILPVVVCCFSGDSSVSSMWNYTSGMEVSSSVCDFQTIGVTEISAALPSCSTRTEQSQQCSSSSAPACSVSRKVRHLMITIRLSVSVNVGSDYIHRVPKKEATKLLAITFSNLNRFSKFFCCRQ